jgi:hypothetical protein
MEGVRNEKNKILKCNDDNNYENENKNIYDDYDYDTEEDNNSNYEIDTAELIKKELLKYTEYLPLCEYLSEKKIKEFISMILYQEK